MSKRLYVGNLPYSTTETELKELFISAGVVESTSIIIDRASGRSKGFGFVEMATVEGAQDAVERFNQTEFGGRTLSVSEARPKEPRPVRDSAGADSE